MDKTQRIIFYILTLIAGAAWVSLSVQPGPVTAADPAPQAGFPAPDFSLKTPEGETYTLSDLRGSAVLVNMWATWCPPCQAEMPAIEKVYNEYRSEGFIVLAVDQTYQDNPLDLAPFIEEYNLTIPILLDETGDTARAYQARSLPSSYFINRYGIITEIVIGGPMSESLLRIRVEEALK
ncbi:MAG: TlpA family protein disulfide reductase [Chloroflexi bacterium]|nr:TlpA family protein disulfide reductase [Chloroflexota bacterium]